MSKQSKLIAPDAAKRGARQASGSRLFVRAAALLIAAISALLILASSAFGATVLNQSLAAAQSLTPPTITSISPTQGKQEGGTAVKIKGTGFVSGAKVYIGSKATSVVVVSETEITATTPEGFGKDEVVVSDEKGVSSGGPSFSYIAPPVVSKVEPDEGSTVGGTSVKIKGTGFLKGSTVKIGAAATSVVWVSETELTAKTAAGAAGEDEVVVTDEIATSASSGVMFTYVTPPTVTKVEPAVGSTLGGTSVTIKGTGFAEGTKVTIGKAVASLKIESETEIVAKTAAGAAGKDEVVASYANGVVSTGGASFTYIAPPVVTSVSPAEGSTAGGTSVKIKGTGFLKGSTVKIGGAATSVVVVSETEITAKTAAESAGKAEVVVTSEVGSSTAGPSFTYATPPTVTKVEPAEGTTLGGASVTIKGTGFVKTPTVTIGKAATSVVWVSETELTAKTAAGTAGKVEVVVTNPNGVASTGGSEYTYVTPPSVTSITPTQGTTLGGTVVKIKGTGFTEEAKVKIGSEATGVTFVSATELTAKTAVGAAGKDEVVVVDEKGTSSSGPDFTYVAPPVVSKVEPDEGSTVGGTSVKIKGTGFLKGSTVKIGAAATSVVWVSETELTAKTAAGAAGEDEVVVTDEIATSASSGVMFTYVTPPTVTKVEPAVGSTLGGTSVTIKGTGFAEGTKVTIGKAVASLKIESETEIVAKTAAGAAGKDEVVASYANGVVSTGGASFTYIAPPVVTSVSPAEGSTAGGTSVKIKGTGFLKGSTVKIGGAATSVVVVSETEITAKTAAESAGKAEVVVTSEVGSSTAGPSFTYATPPTVTKVEPAEGTTLGGASVTIKGTGFVKTPTVTIGKAATSVVWVSETELTAKTAAGTAGKVEVVVTNPNGVASTGGSEYTYVTPPSVTSITPTQGTTLGGTVVKIKGTGFTEEAKVKIGSEATGVTFVSATELTAKTAVGAAGKDEVVVVDEKGTSSSGPDFTYVAPPVVSKVEPDEGSTVGGTSVKIKGTGFLKGSTVKIGAAATSVVWVSETELTAKTAAGAAGEDEVVVTDEIATSASSGVMFTYVTPPTVTKVEPAVGSTLGGTSVTIKGTGFAEGTKVTIGKAVASLKIESETEIVAKTAAGAAGKDEVVASYANGVVSTGGASFTYIAPPVVTSVSPAEGSTAGGTSVKIKGTGFLKGSTVKIGGAATSVVVVSETEITAKTAAESAGKAEVVVTSEVGSSTAGPSFTYATPPTVTKVEPAEGTTLGGASVTIKGTGFVKTPTVTIGKAATSVVWVSETELTAKTAAGTAGKVEVVVTNPNGVASTGGSEYTYVTPPSVTSITPTQGTTLGGTVVKIKGTGFTEEAKVKIGSEATGVTFVSATELTAKTAVGAAGKDEVVVVDEKGTSSSGPDFTYVAPPVVSKVEPDEGSTVGGTSVKIKGTGFLKGSTVKIGAAATSVVWVSETELTAKTAAGAAGEDEVVVTDEIATSASSGVMFTYVTPPTVTKVEPAVGSTLGGTSVTIKGTGFAEGTKVTIGKAVASLKIESETEIVAKTAAGAAGKDEVVASYANGVVSTGGASFTYIAPPVVTSVSPAEGSTAGGTSVKIKGTGFLKGSTVKIGGAATSVVVVSETEITAKTAAESAGKAEVVVTSEVGSSTAGPSFTYATPPTVTKVEPAEGTTLGGASVTIKGTGFVKTPTVTIGKAATSVVWVSETELTAKTAAGTAGKVEVVVTNPNGVASTGGSEYTYVTPPSVTSITPTQGTTLGGTVVKIKGTGFTEEAKVKIGSEATGVTFVSATELTAKTAVGAAGKDEVVVVDEKGTSSSGPDFTYVAPPVVSKVEPDEGSTVGGTSVKIKGTGFLKGSTVKIGAAATSVVWVSETELTAKTAAGAAGEDEVVVTDEIATSASSGVMFTYVTPPTVTKVEPAVGSTLGGTSVTIKGTGFAEGTKVTIGKAVASLKIESETEIVAKTAAGAAGKDEVVASYANGVVSTGGASFTYIAPPVVTSVSPAEGSTAGGTSVKIKGTGFLKGSTVKIGGAATSVVVVSETEITAKTAAESAGKAEVVVTSEVGSSTAGPSFTYATPPTVTKVEPAEGTTLGGASVTIKGTGFVKTPTVTIGKAATSVVWVSETELTAKTAAGTAGKVEVVVTNPNGVASTGGSEYTYVTPPSVTSITPTQGTTLGGTVVKIKGTGFTEEAKVKIGSEATGVTFVSATELTAKTAVGAAGKDEVVVVDEKGTSSSGPDFTYVAPPVVSKVEPDEGSTVGGTSVKIKGTGFLKGSTVKIGAAATSVVWVSETELTAKTAAGAAGEDEVVVTDEIATSASSGVMFTYVTPPTVTKVEPAVGSTLGGTSVTIKGTGFAEGTKVTIGKAVASLKIESETEIVAKTAAGAAGKDEVVASYANGVVSTGGASFTYIAPPVVTSVSPAEGSTAGGTSVKIKGTGFLKGSTVKIGGAATSVVVVSETEITAKTAAESAGKAEVVVTSEVGSSTAGPSFTYATPPTVTKVEPAEGTTLGGASVTIKGTGFVKTPTVTIGKAATSVVWVSETELTAKTAAGTAGKVEVVVTNPNGVASTGGSEYTYVTPPSVTSITPTQGTTLGGTVVKIKGTGFTEEAKVKIGSEATGVTFVSATELTAKTAVGAAGKDEVVVVDEKGTSSSGPDFTYVAPPVVSKVEPDEGSTVGGTSVKIKGTGFLKGSTVKIGAAATSVVWVSETELTAKTAAGAAGEDEVVVTDEIATSASSGVMFTYVTPPTVTKVEPAVGSTLGGTSVTIKGTGFAEGTKVTIGKAVASLKIESETEIVAKTAAGAAGKDEVVASYANGVVSTGGASFTYIAPPVVTSVSPAEGSTAGGTSVKIKGTGFLKGSTVKIGGAATSVVVVSETEITAKTAAESAGKAEVVVTSEVGSSTAGPSFTYATPPTVTKVEPAEGTTLGGASVTIKGTGFVKTPTVTIGKAATSVVWVSETELTAKTAAGTAGKVEVVVTNPNGVASTGGSEYTYVTPPSVTSITPTQGTTLGGTVVKIKGTGFTEEAKVKIGSEATGVTFVSATELTAKTAVGAAGKDEVVVVDEKGTSSSGPDFTYVAPPVVSKVEPDEGSTVGGTSVKIKGTGFLKGSTVKIGAAATSVVWVSETELTAKTAAGAAGEDEVVVTDEIATSASSGVMFTYVTPPTVTKVEPAVGSTLGGTSVTIKGTGFAEGTKVTIGKAVASLKIESETEIVAKTAAGAAGKDEVVASYANGVVSTGGASFTYIAPPVVTSVSPAEGSTAGGTSVKIKGTGFLKGSTVKIGGAATSVVVVSETEITAKTAAESAGKAEVVVTSEVGSSTAGPSFTYATPPTVTKVEPAEGTTLGGASVTIKGTGFVKTPTVTIGKAATSVVWVSETELTAKTAAGTAGKVEVVVTNPNGVASTGGSEYTYVTPPSVTSITPTQGTTLGGTVVKIKGTGFTEEAKVKIGSEATGVTFVSATELTATTAAS